jgi:hypothetical protein
MSMKPVHAIIAAAVIAPAILLGIGAGPASADPILVDPTLAGLGAGEVKIDSTPIAGEPWTCAVTGTTIPHVRVGSPGDILNGFQPGERVTAMCGRIGLPPAYPLTGFAGT